MKRLLDLVTSLCAASGAVLFLIGVMTCGVVMADHPVDVFMPVAACTCADGGCKWNSDEGKCDGNPTEPDHPNNQCTGGTSCPGGCKCLPNGANACSCSDGS